LEQGTVDLLNSLGLGERMQRESMLHHGIELGFNKQRHRIDMTALTGRAITVYGQHEVVKDLIAGAERAGIPILFEVDNVLLQGIASSSPSVRFTQDGVAQELQCEYLAGCDGFHGISRPSVPEGVLTIYEREYPFSWLGILAEAAPSHEELVYMNSERGFALFSMRSPRVTRLYLQCGPTANLDEWSDNRIWDELHRRFECNDHWQPNTGPVLQKSITPMRSFVTEPMQFGRLFLAGDAAHIVPPTGAKGMNLAVSDVKVLSECLAVAFRESRPAALDRYSEICLRRIWRAQRFSWWMTSMLHNDPDACAFDRRRQLAELDYLVHSEAAARSLAENYVGLPIESAF
jgi:p-hydroxybenzoate 3-monooxygenase